MVVDSGACHAISLLLLRTRTRARAGCHRIYQPPTAHCPPAPCPLPACSAKTPLANFATGITILITLLWITPVFTNMSQNVQGAIIIVGVLQLFDW